MVPVVRILSVGKPPSSTIRDMEDYTPVSETGYQRLNGLQAAAYCRIRYTRGNDFKRTERQRAVLQAIEDQAKKADLNTLANLFTKVMENVYTSISFRQLPLIFY